MKKILIVFLILFLTGCGARAEEAQEASQNQQEEVTAVTDRSVVDVDFGTLNSLQLIGEYYYYTRYEKASENQITTLCCRKEKDGPEEILHTYEAEDSIYYMMASCCDGDGKWYNLYYHRAADGEETVYLEQLDASGASLLCQQVREYSDFRNIQDCTVSREGRFCALTTQGDLLVWDEQDEVFQSMPARDRVNAEDWIYSGLINDGETGIHLYYAKAGRVLFQKANFETMHLEASVEVDVSEASTGTPVSEIYETVSVYGNNDKLCYLAGEKKLWSYSFETGELNEILSWSDPYISVDRHQIRVIKNQGNSLVLLSYDPVLKTSGFLVVEQKNADEIPDKTVITLGSPEFNFLLENLDELIERYNGQSTQYQVEIKRYQTSGDGMDELTAALLKGEGPDLIELSLESASYYASKGVMEDLSPYLESSGIKLLKQVEGALRTDGKLYILGTQFTINGIYTLNEYIENGGISTAQCLKMVRDFPDAYPGKRQGRASMLHLMLYADMDTYIDLEEGTCSFDNEEFIRLLTEISGWKKDTNTALDDFLIKPEEFYQKQYLIEQMSFTNMFTYQIFEEYLGEVASFTGYPNREGEEKYGVYFPNHYAINSSSPNKEGAWDFLEYLMSDAEQKQTACFPITEEMFEERLLQAQEKNNIVYDEYTGEIIRGYSLTQESVEQLWHILDHIYYFGNTEAVIEDIITEETGAVFVGDKTAEQAAKIIQERVSLFLQE